MFFNKSNYEFDIMAQSWLLNKENGFFIILRYIENQMKFENNKYIYEIINHFYSLRINILSFIFHFCKYIKEFDNKKFPHLFTNFLKSQLKDDFIEYCYFILTSNDLGISKKFSKEDYLLIKPKLSNPDVDPIFISLSDLLDLNFVNELLSIETFCDSLALNKNFFIKILKNFMYRNKFIYSNEMNTDHILSFIKEYYPEFKLEFKKWLLNEWNHFDYSSNLFIHNFLHLNWLFICSNSSSTYSDQNYKDYYNSLSNTFSPV